MSRVRSREARAHPTAIAATSGRVLSKVAIAPAKPCLVSISGEPRRFSAGTRQSVKVMTAVSEARIPSLCSSRSTFMPGVPFWTTNDLIAARPSDLSSVAQTTTLSARSPEVTKIFSPLRMYSSPSLRAVVDRFAESEPMPGSVIAIAAHVLPKRASCSSLATDAMAELPRPWRGIESSSPTSPQHISMIESTEARLAPLTLLLSSLEFSVDSSRRTPAAPAPPAAPDSESPSIIAASMSSSLGYSCSAASYLREIGRSMFIATWWAWSTSGRTFLGVSRLIIGLFSWVVVLRGVWSRLTARWRSLLDHRNHSDQDRSFHEADGTQIAVPAFDGVLLDVPVATQQLDAVQADLHALLGAEPAGERDLPGGVLAPGHPAGGLVGDQPHALQLDGDVGDHERHRLAVRDRLAEGLPLLDVGRHVVEDGLGGADREGTPGQPGVLHDLAVRRGVT